ncbi:MAG: type I pullulanase [Muribaculaceae bacterium]|nr:type I pullulanase [Muribaculaceae bacterium]
MKPIHMAIAAITALLAPAHAGAQQQTVNYSHDATTFQTITLSDAQAVKLRIYDNGQDGKPVKTVSLKKGATDKNGYPTWNAQVKGDLEGKFYTFDVKYAGKFRGECPGISAKAVGVNGRRGAVIDMASTDPEGWSSDQSPVIDARDLVLYEMHHRDFSIDPSSGLEHKGKFLALSEPKAIAHLKALGVNAVHMLPSFDYASVDESHLENNKYNWGYDPLNYNVPEGGYSTNPADPKARIREFKQMVQALHNAGIKVILDVVYNHTFNIDGSNFQIMMPDEFFRKNADGTYSNGSGCGNETASDRPVMRDYMIESVKYWVDEYHIDGFRFDLMGVHDIETMNAIREALPPHIYIYGEGWSAGSCAYDADKLGMKAAIYKMPGIAAFSDDIRDALRGPFSDDHQAAFLAGLPGHEESIKMGIAGAIKHPQVDFGKVNYSKRSWTLQPTQMISYVSCHDDMCLVDRLKSSIPGITMDELIRLDLLAQTAVFTSQGVPFMLSGEEMLRDKKGVHNSYESPDSINHLDWTNLEKYPQVFNYYKNLIALRQNHRAFHLGDAEMVKSKLEFLPSQDALVAYHLKSSIPGEPWNDIYVVLNANKSERTVTVPKGTYTVVCRNIAIDENGLGTVEGPTVKVPAQSAMIFHN